MSCREQLPITTLCDFFVTINKVLHEPSWSVMRADAMIEQHIYTHALFGPEANKLIIQRVGVLIVIGSTDRFQVLQERRQ